MVMMMTFLVPGRLWKWNVETIAFAVASSNIRLWINYKLEQQWKCKYNWLEHEQQQQQW